MRFVDCERRHIAPAELSMRIKRSAIGTSSFWLDELCGGRPSTFGGLVSVGRGVGGLFFDFGPIRTTRSPRRAAERESAILA